MNSIFLNPTDAIEISQIIKSLQPKKCLTYVIIIWDHIKPYHESVRYGELFVVFLEIVSMSTLIPLHKRDRK